MKKNKVDLTFWLILGVANAIVLYLAYLIFPGFVVLGNATISSLFAVILTAMLLTCLLVLVKPAIIAAKIKVRGDATINAIYGATNIIGLWVLARLSQYLGFGISSFLVAILLGLILTGVQFILWKSLVGKTARNQF